VQVFFVTVYVIYIYFAQYYSDKMVEGGAKCIKYLLFAFNLIFFLAGLIIFVVAIVVQVQFNQYASLFGSNNTSIALIIIGAVIMVIAFFGCCGAYKENYCMIVAFGTLLTVILILEIIFVIIVYTQTDQIVGDVDNGLQAGLQFYKQKGSDGVTLAWDATQQEFNCCGANNFTDWKTVLNGSVPDSCCINVSAGCGKGWSSKKQAANASSVIYTEGCIESVEDFFAGNFVLLGGIGIALILIQVVGIALSGWLAHTIRKEYQVV